MLFSWVHPFRDVSPFRIRPGLRRATFPAGKGFWGVPAPLSVFFWALALAVVFAVLPLIRQPFGLPPSPEGEGFGAVVRRRIFPLHSASEFGKLGRIHPVLAGFRNLDLEEISYAGYTATCSGFAA